MSCCGEIRLRGTIIGLPEYFYNADGSVSFDLPSSKQWLSLFFNRSELNEVNDIKENSVLTFSLDSTVKNDYLLDHFTNPDILDNDYKPIPIQLFVNGTELEYNELLVSQKSDPDDNYEAQIRNNTDFWIDCLKTARLCDLDFDYFTLTKANLLANFPNGFYNDGDDGYYFPLIDYCRDYTTTEYLVEDFRPHFHVLKLMQDICEKCGFCFSSEFYESDKGRELMTYLWNTDLESSNLDGLTFKVAQGNDRNYDTTGANSLIDYWGLVDTGTGLYNPGQIWNTVTLQGEGFCGTGKLIFDLYLDFAVPLDFRVTFGGVTRIISHTGSGIERFLLESEIFETSPDTTIFIAPPTIWRQLPGGVIGVLKGYSTLQFIPTSIILCENSKYPLNAFIDCDITGYNFLTACSHLINGLLEFDRVNNILYLRPKYDSENESENYEGHIMGNEFAVNLTENIVCNSAKKSVPNNDLNRYLQYQFKQSTDAWIEESGYKDTVQPYSYRYDLGSDLNNDIQVNENPLWEPSIERDLETGQLNDPVRVPVYCDNIDDVDNPSFDIGYRLLRWQGYVEQDFNAQPNVNTREWEFDGTTETFVPYASMLPTVTISGGTDISDRTIIYGGGNNKLAESFYLESFEKLRYSANYDMLAMIDWPTLLTLNDFRKKLVFEYRGITRFYELLEIPGYLPCYHQEASQQIIIVPDIQRNPYCPEEEEETCTEMDCVTVTELENWSVLISDLIAFGGTQTIKIDSFFVDGSPVAGFPITLTLTYDDLNIVDYGGNLTITNHLEALTAAVPDFSFYSVPLPDLALCGFAMRVCYPPTVTAWGLTVTYDAFTHWNDGITINSTVGGNTADYGPGNVNITAADGCADYLYGRWGGIYDLIEMRCPPEGL